MDNPKMINLLNKKAKIKQEIKLLEDELKDANSKFNNERLNILKVVDFKSVFDVLNKICQIIEKYDVKIDKIFENKFSIESIGILDELFNEEIDENKANEFLNSNSLNSIFTIKKNKISNIMNVIYYLSKEISNDIIKQKWVYSRIEKLKIKKSTYEKKGSTINTKKFKIKIDKLISDIK